MKTLIFIVLCLLSAEVHSQRRGSGKVLPEDFIGTWTLAKLANKSLDHLPDSVEKKIIKFTKDSIFISSSLKEYVGTWKLERGQLIIDIKGTSQFNYRWVARRSNHIYFTREGLGYYEYFEREK